MKKLITILLSISMLATFAGCDNDEKDTVESTPTTQSVESSQADAQVEDSSITESPEDSSASDLPATEPEGDIVDGALATKDNPVPLGTWASITITNSSQPKPAYARIKNVSTDKAQDSIDEYNSKNPNTNILSLDEHAEFLEYMLVEYEVYFPSNFTDSDKITFWGLILRRENNQRDWIASDGSNYYWMGKEEIIDAPSKDTGYPKNGETVTCKVVYPMIKGYTDYTLKYKERNVELTETIETFFSIK